MVTRDARFRACCGLAAFAGLVAACETEYAQTAVSPGAGGGSAGAGAPAGSGGSAGAGAPAGGAGECPVSLLDRLSVTTLTTEQDIRYKHQSYDRFPTDEHIALAEGPSGDLRVAWLENRGTNVRVTPLDARRERTGADVVVPGFDVGGLVAREDGFMLLTRREDPGEPLRDPAASNAIATAALLVRVRDGAEQFAVAVTGTASIVEGTPPDYRRDCAPVWLNGRLAFNGEKYGAYFQVHGCEGHRQASFYADKLIYADDQGAPVPGGWDWKCSINQGLRLLPEAGAFTALCLSDGIPNPGLSLVNEDASLWLSPEMVTGGYCAGQFGSVVQMGDGSYVVGWLSRGVREGTGVSEAAKQANDIALLRLDHQLLPTGPVTWLRETPDIAEANLHLAPYGSDKLLIVWDSIESLDCDPGPTCFGTYSGTHARIVDLAGNFETPELLIPAPPSTNDDIVVLANGDLAWAFVPDAERDYRNELRLDPDDVPIAPPRRELAVARLRYCR